MTIGGNRGCETAAQGGVAAGGRAGGRSEGIGRGARAERTGVGGGLGRLSGRCRRGGRSREVPGASGTET